LIAGIVALAGACQLPVPQRDLRAVDLESKLGREFGGAPQKDRA
jgi:hypothetical protein